MSEEIPGLVKVVDIKGKGKEIGESELSSLIQDFISKNKEEYPQFALVSMIMDSLETDSDIFRIEKRLHLQEPENLEFLEV